MRDTDIIIEILGGEGGKGGRLDILYCVAGC